MSPLELTQFIGICFAAGEPMFIESAPGCGKTHLALAAANSLDVGFKVCRAPNMDVVDLRGLPDLQNREYTHWIRPETLPFTDKEHPDYVERGLFIVDELPSAVPAMQASFYELCEVRPDGSRWVAGHRIPKGWIPIALGNRMKDKAVVHRMPTPLVSRLAIVELVQDVDTWVDWACSGEPHRIAKLAPPDDDLIEVELIAFIKQFPEHLNNFDPAKVKDNEPYACERSWHRFSRILKVFKKNGLAIKADEAGPKQPFLSQEMSQSIVGKAAANAFLAWLELFKEVPTLAEILLNPSGAPIPEKPSFKYAVSAMVGRAMTKANIDQVLSYITRMPKPFEVLAMQTAVHIEEANNGNKQSFQQTREFIKWATKNQGVIL